MLFSRPRFLASVCTALVAASLGGLVLEARAVAPLKPTEIEVSGTFAIDADLATQSQVPYTAFASYLIRWKDMAFDEEGYRVEFRKAGGTFAVLQYLPPNSSSFVAILQHYAAGTKLQFQVGAYKMNGANVEYSYGPIITHTVGTASAQFNAPNGLTAQTVDDGIVRLSWMDNSTSEVYQQILFKRHADPSYTSLGYIYFNLRELPLQLGLPPGGEYDFRVRATRKAPQDGGSFGSAEFVTNTSNTATITIPPLVAPSGLTGKVTGETSVQLTWTDNSKNETGYQIEYRHPGDPQFTVLATMAANTTTVTVPTPPAATVEFRVRAVYQTQEITTAIVSAPTTPTVQLSTSFPGPTKLVAKTSAQAGAVELAWEDNSSAEMGFEILTRPPGGGDFALAMYVPGGTTTATISSRVDATDTVIPLEMDMTHEFLVRAYYGTTYSGVSNLASATARDGFTSRFYHPATVGLAYTSPPLTPTAPGTPAEGFPLSTQYQMTVSAPVTTTGAVKNWNITGLSTVGLTFDNETGIVTGTPTLAGVFTFPMTATFASGWVANGTLTLRILNPRAPLTSQPIADTTIAPNATFTIPLTSVFSDPESEKAVRMVTSKGTIDILLYPSLAPQAVANFLAYVNAGDYDESVFHRSVENFLLQAGGFKPVATPKSYSTLIERPSPLNEPGISNVRGTISAAKQGGSPNSATHDFFLNLVDNNSTSLNSLDHQNGGFTAFGRVVTPVDDLGQPLSTVYPVLSAIATLPRGDYRNFNVTEPYEASLDKRILVDGTPAGFQDWPMDVEGSAPADMDVLKNVFIETAREIPAIYYSLVTNTDAEVVTATLTGSDLVLKGVKAGTASITVKAMDLENHSSERTFTVTVTANYKGPVITKQPVSVALVAGGKATFSVTATGTALTYQWRKADVNGIYQPLPTANLTATTKSLVLNNVQAEDVGSYDVVVGNATTSLTSSAVRLDFKAGPAITKHPISQVVNVGQPLVLEVAATGAPAPAIAWLRGAAAVAGQTKPKLIIPAAKLTDGGLYTARATNPTNKATSNGANVYVVDPTTVVTTVKPGAKVVLKAAVTGPGLTYQWLKNGAPMLVNNGLISGKQGPVLTIFAADFSDGASYSCRATMLGDLGDVTTGIQKVAVVTRPVIVNYTAALGVVGFGYDFTVPYDPAITNTATKFALTGLPKGLTYDTKTGRITGRPLAAGRHFLKTTINNAAGTSDAATGTLDILPLSPYGTGTFLAAIKPDALNGNMGGRLDLSTLDSGTYSGKLVLGADSYPIAGALVYYPGAYAPQAQITVVRKGKATVLLSFAVDETDGDLYGEVTDGVTSSEVSGFRQFWNAHWYPARFFAGNYNMAIDLKGTDIEKAGVPQGSGYSTMTATTGGTALITTRLPDGVSVTSSSIIGPRGQFLLYQMLYKNTGSMLGLSSFGTTNLGTGNQSVVRVAGDFRWIKDTQMAAAERSYKGGFGPLDMEMIGRTYHAPRINQRIMELPGGTNNARLGFSQGGLEAAVINPDVSLTISETNAVELPAAGSVENPAKVKMTLNAATGLYTGSFELVDPPGSTKRTVTFQGVLIPAIPTTPGTAATSTTPEVPEIPGSAPKSPGFFLLNQLGSVGPPVVTIANSPILSGKVELKPASP